MKVDYIFRSSELKAFSIENVFNAISDEVEKNCTVERVYLPEPQYSMKAFIRNLLFSSKLDSDIYHITGDVHYICFGLPRKRTVLTIHDLRARERFEKKPLKKFIYELFWVKLPVRMCRSVTAISEYTKKEIVEVCPWAANKIVVIPDPINKLYEFDEKEFDSKCPRLLFLGTKENKNHIRMIEAIKEINCIIDIVGVLPDEEKKLLEKYNIRYNNYYHISDEKMVELYKACDVVMFASTYEGFGMPIIEGQKTGRVILTSDISPMNDICGEGACLVDPFDVNAIKQGLLKIIRDEQYRNYLIERGKVNAENYSAKSVAEQYMDIYQEMLKS